MPCCQGPARQGSGWVQGEGKSDLGGDVRSFSHKYPLILWIPCLLLIRSVCGAAGTVLSTREDEALQGKGQSPGWPGPACGPPLGLGHLHEIVNDRGGNDFCPPPTCCRPLFSWRPGFRSHLVEFQPRGWLVAPELLLLSPVGPCDGTEHPNRVILQGPKGAPPAVFPLSLCGCFILGRVWMFFLLLAQKTFVFT